MHPNIKALREALVSMEADFTSLSGFPDSLITGGGAFIRASTPFNTESAAVLCRDKAAVYALLKGKVPMPKTLTFIDPHGSHKGEAEAKSIEEIIKKCAALSYPRIIKMNSGERGQNVYYGENDEDTRLALAHIFNKKSRHYDYLALVQTYIPHAFEWRIAIAGGECVFAYTKGEFGIAPLEKFAKLKKIGDEVIEMVSISWGAVDIIESNEGEFYFIEVNTKPSYVGFIDKHGTGHVARLYESALKKDKQKVRRNLLTRLIPRA